MKRIGKQKTKKRHHSESATVLICSEISDPNWRWVEACVGDTGINFEFVSCVPRNVIERVRFFNLARFRGSLEAISLAKRHGATAIVAHGPTLAAWCGLFARILGLKIRILAHSFNFTVLPVGFKRLVFAATLSYIDRFVVFSTVERDLYAKTFVLPPDRFDIVLWGVRMPHLDATLGPPQCGEYVCAIGGNARDYETLVEAARRLPTLRFVLVVRPESLRGLDLPQNVTTHANLSYPATMNILNHSRFMVLPLLNSTVPCGHVTLVAAMYLTKAFIVTDSLGVRDYIKDGVNGLMVRAGSVDDIAKAIKRLWDDPALCEHLGENGRKFATEACTEEGIAEHFLRWLGSSYI